MEDSLYRTERTYVRLFLCVFLGLILFVAACWGGYHAYARWQERQYLRQARVAFEKNDLRWAALAAQRALSWRSNSLEACRMLAEICELQANGEAMDWRRRAADLAPASLPDLIHLADTALRFASPQIAAETLARVPAEKQNDPAYQSAAARVALARNDLAGALQHLTEAARLAPDALQRQLALAEFELRSDDSARREHGRALALQLKRNPKAQVDALQILLDHALRWGEAGTGLALAKELDAIPNAPFAARVRALTALRVFNDPDYVSALGQMQTEARDSVEKAVLLVNWMNSQGLALLAIDWSKQLPNKMLDTFAMHAALADSYIVMRDWNALAAMLKNGSWASAESLRLALQSKVAHETGDEANFEKDWTAAVDKAGSNRTQLELLQRLAAHWQWADKSAGVLWLLADNTKAQPEALGTLYGYYTETRDTVGLYRTLVRLVRLRPDDTALQNNLALLSTLLNAEPDKARLSARQLHEKEPHNPAFASTYAFALYRAGDIEGALKVMEQLSTAQLDDPAIAVYYGIILAGSGRKREAQHYIDVGNKAKLLPEEEALLARARTQVAER